MQSRDADHPFLQRPNRTLIRLSVPVLFSLVAEPLTGLIDTAFVARLGSTALAALGVGTMALSATFWIFNFLGVATQTEVASADGRGDAASRAEFSGLALSIALLLGAAAAALLTPMTSVITRLLGAADDIQAAADTYTKIRWLGAPAVIAVIAGFGAMRGVQDMKTPMWIAGSIHAVNILLDWLLIFGIGPFPAMGIAGAAVASVAAQWCAALVTVAVLIYRMKTRLNFHLRKAARLFRIGWDLFVRTGMLTLFLLVATRQATRLGADVGAAHQAIRQFWLFTALFLDSFAITGQSLVAYFVGALRVPAALRVARSVCLWSLGAGTVLALIMGIGLPVIERLLVPESARALFFAPWLVATISQPLNALTFATDGIHWGTGDFRYLRNATTVATLIGLTALWTLDGVGADSLLWIWFITTVWIVVRAAFGMLRIWPGSKNAPLGRRAENDA